MSCMPEMVARRTPFSAEWAACMRVRSISIGLTASAASTLAALPATSGAYTSPIPTMGLRGLVRSQSYPAKYITLAGMAMSSVGLRPRQSVHIPSLRAIFRIPSRVELKVRRWVSSAAQSEMMASSMTAACEGAATQNWDWFCTQKTSRQQAVTPRLGGSCTKEGRRVEGDGLGCWDCNRTRTTSRGVTACNVSVGLKLIGREHSYSGGKSRCCPSRQTASSEQRTCRYLWRAWTEQQAVG